MSTNLSPWELFFLVFATSVVVNGLLSLLGWWLIRRIQQRKTKPDSCDHLFMLSTPSTSSCVLCGMEHPDNRPADLQNPHP